MTVVYESRHALYPNLQIYTTEFSVSVEAL
jgi:hypothetical protein